MSRANATRLSDQVSLDIQRQLANTPRYNRWLADLVRPAVGQRVLDFGAGLGNVTAHLLDRELLVALEPDPVFCAELHARFDAHPQARVLAGALPDTALTAELRALDLDSVVSFNVLEHIADDAGVCCQVADVLPAGGRLALVVPALQTLYGSWDAADGHFRRYAPGRLRRLLQGAGFEVERLRYLNLPGVLPWFLNGRVLRRPYAPGAAFRLYDRVVPLIRLVEDRWSPPLGQSLVVVARRT
jgi:SAM-dependent methyltransferase